MYLDGDGIRSARPEDEAEIAGSRYESAFVGGLRLVIQFAWIGKNKKKSQDRKLLPPFFFQYRSSRPA